MAGWAGPTWVSTQGGRAGAPRLPRARPAAYPRSGRRRRAPRRRRAGVPAAPRRPLGRRQGGVIPELLTPAGREALALATEVATEDPLVAAEALRRNGIAPDLAAAALTQATLRVRAVAKFGPDAARMFFTRAGLEQAPPGAVAARRAER